MEKKVIILCFGIILSVFYGCNEEREKSTETAVQQEISGSWKIKEAKMDISSQNILLNISKEGTWVMKRGGDSVDFGTFEKKAGAYIFTSERNSEKFTVNVSSLGNDILDMKIKSDKGLNLEISGLKAEAGTVKKAETVPSRAEIQGLSTENKCEQTEKTMKQISTALEAYAVDWGFYPSGSFERMKEFLSPFYIKDLPVTDAWGNEWVFEIYYDKKDPSWPHTKILSIGKDGLLNYSSSDELSSSGDDVVMIDGYFIKKCSKGR